MAGAVFMFYVVLFFGGVWLVTRIINFILPTKKNRWWK